MENILRRAEHLVDGFINSSASLRETKTESVFKKTQLHESEYRPDYYLKEENYIDNIITNSVIRASLKSIADKYYNKTIKEIIEHSSKITNTTYPSLYLVISKCCTSLNINNCPSFYITNVLRGINALSMEVEGNKYVLLSRRVAAVLSTTEQSFIIGHELGHHQQGNLVCHTVNGLLNSLNAKSEIFGPLISDTIEVPLKRWCRLSEFNADRAGLVCCKDINVVKQLFVKLGMIENPTAFNLYQETSEDHPLLSTRYNELKSFAQSYKNRLCL